MPKHIKPPQAQPLVSYRVIGPPEFDALARAQGTNMTTICAQVGFSRRTYTRWKNGWHEPDLITGYRNLLAALGVLDQ